MDRFKNLKPNLLKSDCRPIPKVWIEEKKTGYKKASVPESTIQRQVDAYLELLGVRAIRIPDSLYRAVYAQRSVPVHVKANIAKYIAGLPDLLIPRLTDKGLIMLALELKSEKGKLSPKQVKWQKHLGTVVAHSFEEAKTLIDVFLND